MTKHSGGPALVVWLLTFTRFDGTQAGDSRFPLVRSGPPYLLLPKLLAHEIIPWGSPEIQFRKQGRGQLRGDAGRGDDALRGNGRFDIQVAEQKL